MLQPVNIQGPQCFKPYGRRYAHAQEGYAYHVLSLTSMRGHAPFGELMRGRPRALGTRIHTRSTRDTPTPGATLPDALTRHIDDR